MLPSPFSPPPLPPGWPYNSRGALPSLGLEREVALPGHGEGWALASGGDLSLTGTFEPLGGAFGRGGVGRVGEVVLRPYRRGGLIRHVNERTYRTPQRFASEYQVHRALWESGFPTVRPLGYAWRAHGWGVEGMYLTAFSPGAPWPSSWTETIWPKLVQAMEALSAWGCWSPDLNATNVHVVSSGEPWILDFDRAHFATAVDLMPKYQRRLARSLEKLGAPHSLRERVEAFPW